jgi:ribonuclease VapC
LSEAVLDASALLAGLQGEPGGHVVEESDAPLHLSSVNLAEVVAKLVERGGDEPWIRRQIGAVGPVLHPFDTELAYEVGLLRSATHRFGLSLGDRACLALARRLKLPVLTTDRLWAELSLGVDVRLIR